METSLNILVLHNLGHPSTWRNSMADHELCLPRFAPEHNYIVHDFLYPVTRDFRSLTFDAVIFNQTFLSKRRSLGLFNRIRSDYGFFAKQSTLKIALPQDDYDCSNILDQWMCEWNVDIVYPVCANDWDVLYPQYGQLGELRQGYTGYISDALIERTGRRRLIADRSIDVGYRAASFPPYCGKLGYIKQEIARQFITAVKDSGSDLVCDVSVDPSDILLGAKWPLFVENVKCMLGVNSGSSLLDPDGHISDSVQRFLRSHPGASFEEVEAGCFPDRDGQYQFTAISPRNLECALFGTAQILTPGPYGGFIQPWDHYIPLEPDMSNFDQVAPLIRNHSYLQQMADRCREAILSYHQLRYTNHVQDLIDTIRERTRLLDAERRRSAPLIENYRRAVSEMAPRFWRKQRAIDKTRQAIGDLGLRRLKYLIKDLMEKRSRKVNA